MRRYEKQPIYQISDIPVPLGRKEVERVSEQQK
jgi:hypothetical protein